MCTANRYSITTNNSQDELGCVKLNVLQVSFQMNPECLQYEVIAILEIIWVFTSIHEAFASLNFSFVCPPTYPPPTAVGPICDLI